MKEYSIDQLENLNELQDSYLGITKACVEVADQLKPLEEELNSVELQLIESENKYNELRNKTTSSVDDIREQHEMVSNLVDLRKKHEELERKVLDLGSKLEKFTAHRKEINDSILNFGKEVKNKIVPTKKSLKGNIIINKVKNTFDKINIDIKKAQIISTKKSAISILKNTFDNAKEKVISMNDELKEKIEKSSLIKIVSDYIEDFKQEREAYEQRIKDNERVKEIQQTVDRLVEEQKQEEINLDEINYIPNEDGIKQDISNDSEKEKVTITEDDLNSQLFLDNINQSTKTKLNVVDSKTYNISHPLEETELVREKTTLQNETKNTDDSIVLPDSNLNPNKEFYNQELNKADDNIFSNNITESKLKENEFIDSINQNSKGLKIENSEDGYLKRNQDLMEKNQVEYVDPAISFKHNGVPFNQAEIINNVQKVAQETYKQENEKERKIEKVLEEKKAKEEIASQQKTNIVQFPTVNKSINTVAKASKDVTLSRTAPIFMTDGMAKVVKKYEGKVQDVYSAKEYLEIKKDALMDIKQNATNKNDYLAASSAIDNIFGNSIPMEDSQVKLR